MNSPRAAVLAWDEDPEQARLRGRPDGLLRKAVLEIDFGRERQDRTLRQLAYRGPKSGVGGDEFKVQVRR